MSFSQDEYHLVGIVEFIHRRTDVTDPIGHYVAIAHRRDYSWVIYDDTKDREKVLTKKFEASIEILLYVRRYFTDHSQKLLGPDGLYMIHG